jgi:tight adherence protein B
MSITILIIGIVVVMLVLIVGIVITMQSRQSLVEERLDSYMDVSAEMDFEFGRTEEEGQEKESFLISFLSNRVEGSSFGERVQQSLARADLKLKMGEFVALMIISSFGTAVIGFFVGGTGIFALVFAAAGAILGIFIPQFVVGLLQGRRLGRFSSQLPDMLVLMVNGLRAGFSTMQALEAVSKELPPPINDEFRRVVQEMQLGIPMDKALDNLLRRIPSEDLDLVVTAINVQREVGGNLAEILETITHTIRERIRIKGEIKTLTSQVVYSGRFLAIMPIIVGLLLWVINRDYMMEFFASPICGGLILGCAGLMITAGFLVMNKIADIEV